MLEWEAHNAEPDQLSFEDSDRFEEDSLCSWVSEQESVCTNWRGWKRTTVTRQQPAVSSFYSTTDQHGVISLVELCARQVAAHIPFEVVERVYPPVPEQIQLRITYWSFPDSEEDIRLYSCLANGSADEFLKGEHLFKSAAVHDSLQIGFHLSARVEAGLAGYKGQFNVAVTLDRKRIGSCTCTCGAAAAWCSHVVAVCLQRIHNPTSVRLRAPVSESLSRLSRDQLQRFAQYLISELSHEMLPTAQRLLDDLLSGKQSRMNMSCGAPDPTAGASVQEQTSWCLDQRTLQENIRKILIKFCLPSPTVFSDVNCLSTSAPPAAAEWTSLLRPLRGREPEGMWNLLSIVREMMKRHDRNAIPLLEIVTEECLQCDQIVIWWVNTKLALHLGGGHLSKGHPASNSQTSQHACASLCDEIVVQWRLVALSPTLNKQDRQQIRSQFLSWHLKVLDKYKAKSQTGGGSSGGSSRRHSDTEVFPGFKPAIEACELTWSSFGVGGWQQERIRHAEPGLSQQSGPVHSSDAVLHMADVADRLEAGNRSSVSSEGFCETEDQDAASVAEFALAVGCSAGGQGVTELHGEDAEQPPPPPPPPSTDQERVLAAVRPVTDHWEVLFARAEGLHAHGFTRDACCIGVKLAQQLLSCPPDLSLDPALLNVKVKKRRGVNPLTHQVTCLASVTLSRCSFLCTVLVEEQQHHHLAFQVGLFALELARPPASTKPLEVKLANQESELLQQLRRIPLTSCELRVLRERADALRAGRLQARGQALVPLTLATLIHDALVTPAASAGRGSTGGAASGAGGSILAPSATREPGDAELGFQAAVAALGLKANVSEADHPLLCEGTRRQRGDLTILLLVHYKDDQEKLAKIMDRLLDKEVHRGFKAPTVSSYYSARAPAPDPRPAAPPASAADLLSARDGWSGLAAVAPSVPPPPLVPPANLLRAAAAGARPRELRSAAAAGREGSSGGAAGWEQGYRRWESRQQRSSGAGPGGVGSAHPRRLPTAATAAAEQAALAETASSDNSPTLVRRGWARPSGPGSDSGSSGKSSDSAESSDSAGEASPAAAAAHLRDARAAVAGKVLRPPQQCSPVSATTTAAAPVRPYPALTPESLIVRHSHSKAARFKNKRIYPSVPNQPSEAGAHFMFELAKTVLAKAGGNSSTSLFTQPSDGAHRGPHRALQMCAFQIGLYALGLHNCVTPNWLSRTYSSHVSWITGQVMELGAAAISCLVDTWEGHLTPPEAAHIADCASRSRDGHMVRAAVGLTLSILPHAHALNQNEIQRALLQCKEQSTELLEKACLAVEGAAKGGGVYPEVLFDIATKWYQLFELTSPKPVSSGEEGAGGAAAAAGGDAVGLVDSPPPAANPAAAAVVPPPHNLLEPPPPVPSAAPAPAAGPPLPAPAQAQLHLSVATGAPYPVTYSCLAAGGAGQCGVGVNQLQVQMFVPFGPTPQFPTVQLYPAVSMQNVVRSQAPLPGGGSAVPMFQLPPQPHPHMVMLAPPPAPPPQPPPAAPPPQQAPTAPLMVPVTLAAAAAAAGLQHRPPPGPQPMQAQQGAVQPPPPPPPAQLQPPPPQLGQVPRILGSPPLKYLFCTYRVGMLALETLARRVHDDRATKYSPQPPYGDDVKWLLGVAMKLGTPYVHQFCLCCVNSVVSPFVLYDIAVEVNTFLTRHNTAHQYRSQILTPLVQQCQQVFLSCMYVRLCHITPAEYDDFVSIVRTARVAFSMTTGGPAQLNEFLQAHRRNKLIKKELWMRVTLALQAPPTPSGPPPTVPVSA